MKAVVALEPDNGFYLDSLGWVYYRKDDAERAIKYVRRAILAMQGDDAILRDHRRYCNDGRNRVFSPGSRQAFLGAQESIRMLQCTGSLARSAA